MNLLRNFSRDKTAKVIDRFVSLGDNCEFGFVQRALGYEGGGLLRWAVTNPDPLLMLLESGFDNLYRYNVLTPSAHDMVRDNHYGIAFHTKMVSQGGQFIHPERDRRPIHKEEMQKIRYLCRKIKTDLSDPSKIFVYKHNQGVSDAFVRRLRTAMDRYGQARLLVVFAQGDGSNVSSDKGVMRAVISRFADYSAADDARYQEWYRIIRKASKAVRRDALATRLFKREIAT